MSKQNKFRQFAISQEVYDAYKAYMLLEDMTFVEFATVIYPIVLEARRAATQKFAGLHGIGGDNNEHVAIYRN